MLVYTSAFLCIGGAGTLVSSVAQGGLSTRFFFILFAPAGHEQQVHIYIWSACRYWACPGVLPVCGIKWTCPCGVHLSCGLSSATKCERQFGVQVESMDNLPSLSPIRSHMCLCACPRTHKCIHTGLVGGDPMICVLGGFWFPDSGPVYIYMCSRMHACLCVF